VMWEGQLSPHGGLSGWYLVRQFPAHLPTTSICQHNAIRRCRTGMDTCTTCVTYPVALCHAVGLHTMLQGCFLQASPPGDHSSCCQAHTVHAGIPEDMRAGGPPGSCMTGPESDRNHNQHQYLLHLTNTS
jgi:hypothetical protein